MNRYELYQERVEKMKIKIEKYDTGWSKKFVKIKSELFELIGFLHPEIEHIGGSSFLPLPADRFAPFCQAKRRSGREAMLNYCSLHEVSSV